MQSWAIYFVTARVGERIEALDVRRDREAQLVRMRIRMTSRRIARTRTSADFGASGERREQRNAAERPRENAQHQISTFIMSSKKLTLFG